MVIIITAIVLSVGLIIAYGIGARQQRKAAEQYMQDLENHKEFMKQLHAQNAAPVKKDLDQTPYRVVAQGTYEQTTTTTTESDDSDFLTSMAVAAATDSALIGMAVGGDPMGAMVGDMLNDSDSTDHGYSDDSSDYSSDDTSNSDY